MNVIATKGGEPNIAPVLRAVLEALREHHGWAVASYEAELRWRSWRWQLRLPSHVGFVAIDAEGWSGWSGSTRCSARCGPPWAIACRGWCCTIPSVGSTCASG